MWLLVQLELSGFASRAIRGVVRNVALDHVTWAALFPVHHQRQALIRTYRVATGQHLALSSHSTCRISVLSRLAHLLAGMEARSEGPFGVWERKMMNGSPAEGYRLAESMPVPTQDKVIAPGHTFQHMVIQHVESKKRWNASFLAAIETGPKPKPNGSSQ